MHILAVPYYNFYLPGFLTYRPSLHGTEGGGAIAKRESGRVKCTTKPVEMSYESLEIYQESLDLFFIIYPISLRLPKKERYRTGDKVRRTADEVVTTIAEGDAYRTNKPEYLKFLNFAHYKTQETILHIFILKLLFPDLSSEMQQLQREYYILGTKIAQYMQYVRENQKPE